MQLDHDSPVRITNSSLLSRRMSKFFLFAHVPSRAVRWEWRQSDLDLPSFRGWYQLHDCCLEYFQIA